MSQHPLSDAVVVSAGRRLLIFAAFSVAAHFAFFSLLALAARGAELTETRNGQTVVVRQLPERDWLDLPGRPKARDRPAFGVTGWTPSHTWHPGAIVNGGE